MRTILKKVREFKKGLYIKLYVKYGFGHCFALTWLLFSVYISQKWIEELAKVVGKLPSILIISGIAYIPGYMVSFMVISLLMDKQPPLKSPASLKKITVIIAAYNEEPSIGETLTYLKRQIYAGELKVILIDNHSSDDTVRMARKAAERLKLDLTILSEKRQGKHYALNKGLMHVDTEWVVTLDADTLLHPMALKTIVSRIESSPDDVSSVAGAILVKNSRDNLWTKLQEWDYFLAIASVKRLQGMYRQTLVAQGAFSIYKTEVVKEIGGWSDAIGEDIVLTWKMLSYGWKVYFEPKAIAFTTVPATFRHLAKQRSRWARGMLEGLKEVKPWRQPSVYGKYLTGINFIMPFIDISFVLFWIPGVIFAFFGYFWIAGPLTLLVLPLTVLSYFVVFVFQRRVFSSMHLKIRKNIWGLVLFVLFYQIVMSPISVYGYFQESLKLKRVWK